MSISDTQQTAQFAAQAAVSAAEAKQYLLSIQQPVVDISESVADAQNSAAKAEMARDQAQDIADGLVQTIDSQLSEQEVQFESQMTTQQSSFDSSQSERESSFEEKSNEFELRFSSQLSTQGSTFSESQSDKEHRFQQFLLNSGYVFLGNYVDGPFQFSARNQYIRYDNQYYRLNAATDVGFTTTGTDAASFANDVTHFVLMDGDTLRQELGSNEQPGTNIVALKYSGTVADALVDIYVDALGYFKNKQDGCTEAIMEAVAHWGGRTDSAYVEGQKKYGRIHFANGTYALKDLPLIAGWEYKLDPFTLIVPHRDADFAFTTIGTLGAVVGEPTWQRLMYCEINGGVIGDYWKETGNVPVGAGGINLLNGSYVRLRNIAIRHIRGIAIYGGELFDSPFENVSVMFCGNDDPDNYAPCVLFDNAGGRDATNACKFDKLHLEANHTGGVWNKCRHMIFTSIKVERDAGTHILAGCSGMNFVSPELTFNRDDIPQFLIKDLASDAGTGQAASDSRGITFAAPSCISNSVGKGWYFQHTGNAGPLNIKDLFGSGTGLIFKGKNAIISGGTTYDCGPVLVDAEKDVTVDLVKWYAIRKTAVGDGTDDAIIFRGANCKAENNDFTGQPVDSSSLAIPNGAFINSVASADSVIKNNTVGGYRQYGIRAAVNQKVRDNKINAGNNHITSLTNQSRSNSTLVIDNTTGFGIGTVNQSVPVLAAGATQELVIVGGCTDLHIRVISGTTAAAAKVLADASIAGLGVYSQLNPALLSFSAGSPGDGMVHITKPLSGASITVANYTAGNVTVVITRTNVMPA
ncbi:hypothetical protein [Klebsiella variicola]|uniref:hypothetical protein n=1 Tax=Klebsiella variicola TaxID=244366 RepID=UPI001A9C8989|nr:hypothetical protein [Klebsiella variicola]